MNNIRMCVPNRILTYYFSTTSGSFLQTRFIRSARTLTCTYKNGVVDLRHDPSFARPEVHYSGDSLWSAASKWSGKGCSVTIYLRIRRFNLKKRNRRKRFRSGSIAPLSLFTATPSNITTIIRVGRARSSSFSLQTWSLRGGKQHSDRPTISLRLNPPAQN